MTREEAIKIVRGIYQTDAEKEALDTLIPELKESDEDKIMRYEVEITRVSYSTVTFGVEAYCRREAEEIAMGMAYSTAFSEDSAEYEINSCSESELTDEEWEEAYGD